MVEFDKIWVEKYRPSKLDDLILDASSLRVVSQFKDEIPNLLFVGSPGTGKTTLARIIVNDILGCNFLYINASDESGIDTIRHNITNFAQTKSFDGNVKVVVLDEADGLTSRHKLRFVILWRRMLSTAALFLLLTISIRLSLLFNQDVSQSILNLRSNKQLNVASIY